MTEEKNKDVFNAKSVKEQVDVEVIIKDKRGIFVTKCFKDCIFNETASMLENDTEYLQVDFTFKGKSKNFSTRLK